MKPNFFIIYLKPNIGTIVENGVCMCFANNALPHF